MSQIKQLIILHQQGKGRKTIARLLNMSKNTVKSYLDKLQALTTDKESGHLSVHTLLNLELPVLEAKFHAGNPAYKDERFEHFKTRAAYYIEELSRVGVNKQVLWAEYKQERPMVIATLSFVFISTNTGQPPIPQWYLSISRQRSFL